jgi:ubiquinone biosynthesis monooxygenase Coq7
MNLNPLRQLDRTDTLLDRFALVLQGRVARTAAARPNPALDTDEAPLDAAEQRASVGMMRINHSGEVCAQALYLGQAAVARDPLTRAELLAAAAEETDHLDWCGQRLQQLAARPSRFNPIWYAGSFAIGAGAALFGDAVSLGFVVETERQVEAHLGEHLRLLPAHDARSRAIVGVMQQEEARHGDHARALGGVDLPPPVSRLMALAANLMKAVAYRF